MRALRCGGWKEPRLLRGRDARVDGLEIAVRGGTVRVDFGGHVEPLARFLELALRLQRNAHQQIRAPLVR